jgi:hypothetical protein
MIPPPSIDQLRNKYGKENTERTQHLLYVSSDLFLMSEFHEHCIVVCLLVFISVYVLIVHIVFPK